MDGIHTGCYLDRALHDAVVTGSIGRVRALMHRGAQFDDEALITTAARSGNLPLLEFLMERIHTSHSVLEDSLCEAAGRGHLGVVSFILDSTDLDLEFSDAVYCAVEAGHIDVVRKFVGRGIPYNHERDLLSSAVYSGSIEMVELVCTDVRQARTNISAQVIAVQLEHLRVLRWFVDIGSDIHARQDILMRAAMKYRSWKVARYITLLDLGYYAERGAEFDGGGVLADVESECMAAIDVLMSTRYAWVLVSHILEFLGLSPRSIDWALKRWQSGTMV